MLAYLDYLGVAVFAATGALAASRRELDIVAFIFFAAVTGIGGGTLRDVLLDTGPVFWISDPFYLAVAAAVGVLVYFTAHFAESRYRVLLWADAIGMAAYAVLGAAKALSVDAPAGTALVMGLMTATFGGLLRDVIAGEPSVMLRREVYVTAAFAGASTFVVLVEMATPFWSAALIAFAVGFAVRAGALIWGWRLPVYRQRAGRPPS